MRTITQRCVAIALTGLLFIMCGARNPLGAQEAGASGEGGTGGISVTPDGGTATMTAGDSSSVTFSISNSNSYGTTFDVVCGYTGNVSGCAASSTSIWVPAYGSESVTVVFTASTAGSGTVSLDVWGDLGVSDYGYFAVTINAPQPTLYPPSVSVNGSATVEAYTSGHSASFSITNPSDTARTYNVGCSFSGSVNSCGTAATAEVGPGATVSPGVDYSVGAAGSGSVTLTATDPGVGSGSATFGVTVSAPPPSMSVSQVSLTFNTPQYGAPAVQSVTVSNDGGGTLNWSATSNTSWLSVSPASGSAGSSVTASINNTSMAPGTYSGSFTLNASAGNPAQQVIDVTLTVTQPPPPSMSLSTTTLTFRTPQYTQPAAQQVTVSNNGGAPFTYTVGTPTASWLSVTADFNTPGTAMLVSASTSGLPPGDYSASFTVTASAGTPTQQTVNATLTVQYPIAPVITSPPTVIAAPNGSGSANFTVRNPSATLVSAYPFTCGFGGAATTCTQPATQQIDADATVTVPVPFTTGASGNGTVTLSSAGSTGTANVIAVTPATIALGDGYLQMSENAIQQPVAFTITNPNAVALNFSFSCTRTGSVQSCDGVAAPRSIGANASFTDTVLVSVTSGLGTVTFRATDQVGVWAEGTYQVNAAPIMPPDIDPISYAVTLPANDTLQTVSYSIYNPNYQPRTYAVTCMPTSGLSNCTTLTPVEVPARQTRSGTLRFSTGVGPSEQALQYDVRDVSSGQLRTGMFAITLLGPPSIVLSVDSLMFTGRLASGLSAPQQVVVSNTGVTRWHAATQQTGWLSIMPDSGEADEGFDVRVDFNALPDTGTYTGYINVTASGLTPRQIKVIITVQPKPFTVDTLMLGFTAKSGGPQPTPQAVTISKTGGGSLNWNTTKSVPWLQVTPPSGTLVDSGVFNVTINTNPDSFPPLSVNTTRTGTIIVGATGYTHTETIVVTVTGADTARYRVDKGKVDLFAVTRDSAVVGDSASTTFKLINMSPGTSFDWKATVVNPRIDIVPDSSRTVDTMTVTLKYLGGDSAGIHNDTVTITSTNAIPAVLKIPLRLLVNPRGAPFPTGGLETEPVSERSLCLTIAAAKEGAYECGALRLTHALPATRTMNKLRAPTLLYLSTTAEPNPLVPIDVVLPSSTQYQDTALSVKAKITFAAGWDTATWTVPADWAISRIGPRRVVLTGSYMRYLETGVHDYTLSVAAVYKNGVEKWSVPLPGRLLVVNRRSSDFGAGWALAGHEMLQSLPSDPDRAPEMLWVGGDGSARIYRRNPAPDTMTYVGPAVDGPDILRYRPQFPDSQWVRELKGGNRVLYDSFLRHRFTVNRLGHTTEFGYQPSTTRLTSIALPVPFGAPARTYTFSYQSGKVLIASPAISPTQPRADTLIFEAGTNRVQYIAGTKVGTASNRSGINYAGATNRIQAFINRIPARSQWYYDAGGHLNVARTRMPVDTLNQLFTSAETRGIAAPQDLAALTTVYDGPRTDVPDITTFWVNPFGAPDSIRDASGGLTVLARNDPRFKALVTMVQHPSRDAGILTEVATYTTRGNIETATVLQPHDEEISLPTRYEYDSNWPDFVTKITSPKGVVSKFAYDSATGNRKHQEVGQGHRPADFAYYPLTDPKAPGLMWKMTVPRDLGGTVNETLDYDVLGNLSAAITPRGLRTEFVNDDVGRVRQKRVPFNLNAPAGFDSAVAVIEYTDYDPAGRLLETRIAAGLRNGVAAQALSVVNTYDAEGRLLTVTRSASGASPIVTGFRYDAAGRRVAELAADATPENLLDNPKDSLVYDAAHNVTKSINRRGLTTTRVYDALNRMQGVYTEEVPYDSLPAITGDSHRELVLSAQTDTFAYDGSSNAITFAGNAHARTLRQYWRNGQLRNEVQKIRDLQDTTSWSHEYSIGYEYDLDGRRTRLTLPNQIAPRDSLGSRQSGTYDYIGFDYDPDTGELETVTDPMGLAFTLQHHLSGSLKELARPGAIREFYGYDDDGNLTGDTIQSGYRSDVYTYDASGRVVEVTGTDRKGTNSAEYQYSGLGHLVLSEAWRPPSDELITSNHSVNYTYDALGNVLSTASTDQESFLENTVLCQNGTCSLVHGGYQSFGNATKRYGTGVNAGRLLVDSVGPARLRRYVYDESGNVILSGDSIQAGSYYDVRSYYDAQNRLRLTSRADCFFNQTECLKVITEEEYWYDALGRRVAVFTTRPPIARNGLVPVSCPPGHFIDDPLCGANREDETNGLVRRMIWDGDQELGEIQRFFSDESDALPATPVTAWPMVGNVVYTPGLSVDQPLSVVRSGYADNEIAPFPGRPVVRFNAYSILPLWNRQGMPAGALYSSSVCKAPADSVCIRILFPDAFSPHDRWRMSFLNMPQLSMRFWHGSLLEDKRDGSGLLYRRNRYYDPGTGRFTQEDPIGLAGGLNLYGFAGGDPVNSSDPFGLCDDPKDPSCRLLNAAKQTIKKYERQAGEVAWKVANVIHDVLSPSADGRVTAGNVQVSRDNNSTNIDLSSQVALKAGLGLTWGSTSTNGQLTFGGTFGHVVILGGSVSTDGKSTSVSVSAEVGVEFKASKAWANMLSRFSVGLTDPEK